MPGDSDDSYSGDGSGFYVIAGSILFLIAAITFQEFTKPNIIKAEVIKPQSQQVQIEQGQGIEGLETQVQGQVSTSSITVNGASLELETTIRADIAMLPQPLQSALSKGSIEVVPGRGPITGSGGNAVATASHDGTTTIYDNGDRYFPGVLAHEGGHHLATKTWGTADPPKDYESYWHSEGGVTKYGSIDPAEDFAEAIRLYTEGKLQSVSPTKHAYIAKLLNQ